MRIDRKILYLFIILFILILPGCVFFDGEYQASKTPYTTGEEGGEDFTEGNKMIAGRLDDMANGLANVGEPAVTGTPAEKSQETSQNPLSQPSNNTASPNSNMPEIVIQQGKSYGAVLHTEAGDIEIEFTADQTPMTVNNFVYLAKKNFYDNTIFHRAISGFMIQGGDPKGDGTGGPGYRFADEDFAGEYTRGTVAMANSGPDTNGSQFFIMHKDYPLQKNYVIFGHVVKGIEAVDKIATAPVQTSASGEKSQPVTPVKITGVDIIEK